MKNLLAALLFAVCFFALARADTPDPPNVGDWEIKNTSHIDVRISELVVVYLGFQTLYENPENPNEFVLITKRFRPMVPAKTDPKDNRTFRDAVINSYTQKELKDVLCKRYDEADAIIYQRWHLSKDIKTGQFIRAGDVEIWFLDSGGNWNFVVNQKVSVSPVSELKSGDFKDGVLAGIKYSVGDSHQIIRAEHTSLVVALKEEGK